MTTHAVSIPVNLTGDRIQEFEKAKEILLSLGPNPPMDRDGRHEDSGRG